MLHAAKALASLGRDGDTELLHVTKSELQSLDAEAKRRGLGGLPRNPHTGLHEASWFEDRTRAVENAGQAIIDNPMKGIGNAVGAIGSGRSDNAGAESAATTVAALAAIYAAPALFASSGGEMGYTGYANMMGGATPTATAATNAVTPTVAPTASEVGITGANTTISPVATSELYAAPAAPVVPGPVATAAPEAFVTPGSVAGGGAGMPTYGTDVVNSSVANLGATGAGTTAGNAGTAGTGGFFDSTGAFISKHPMESYLMGSAAIPIVKEAINPTEVPEEADSTTSVDLTRNTDVWDPKLQAYVDPKTGQPSNSIRNTENYGKYDVHGKKMVMKKPKNIFGMAGGGLADLRPFAEGGAVDITSNYVNPVAAAQGAGGAIDINSNYTNPVMAAQGAPAYNIRANYAPDLINPSGGTDTTVEGWRDTATTKGDTAGSAAGKEGYARWLADYNSVAGLNDWEANRRGLKDVWNRVANSGFVTFGPTLIGSKAINRGAKLVTDNNYNPYSTYNVSTKATGGIIGLASGGAATHSRYLQGSGDGMSDSIPAYIDGGKVKEPIKVADGEYVVSADVVSHIGNGSSNAGAKKLDRMMAGIRQARTGKKSQAPQVNAEKLIKKAVV